MFQDGLDDLPVFDEADDPDDSPTLRTSQGIDPVDLLNQPGPVFPVFLRTFIGFQDAGEARPLWFLSAFPGKHYCSSDSTVLPPSAGLPPVRDVGAHGGQPFQGITWAE
ncbi:MAG: hypothetical protein LUQ65_06950 [Candidatus Helarchaeota archaeon]|nr:hypothetical protein [Candidatus Helarchaeota archaeon]